MKQRWIRRVAVVLVLCLLFNDNLTGVFIRTQAVEKDASVASFDVSGNDAVSSGDVIVEKEDVSDDIPKLPDETEEAEDSIEKESDEEDLGLPETELIEANAASSQLTLPSTEAEFHAAVEAGRTTFYISTPQDFLDAQALCEIASINGFAGITLVVSIPQADGIWDIGSIAGFEGIGATTPFRGTLTCEFLNGNGIQFRLNKPLIVNMGDGATISQMDLICEGTPAAIAQNISGNVTISGLWLRGAIGNGSGTVGTFASTIESNSHVTVSDTRLPSGIVTINGATAGGFAGIAGDNVTITLEDSVNFAGYGENTVTGSRAAGGCFGEVMGSYTWNISDQTKYPLRVIGNSPSAYSGRVVGIFTGENGAGTLTITGGNSLQSNMSGAGNSGGLVGFLGGGANIAIPEGGLTITGSIDANTGSGGGVVGVLDNTSIQFENYTINATVGGMQSAGGIVGRMQGGKCIIKNVAIKEVTGPGTNGGVMGIVTNNAAVELQGTISITTLPHGNGSNGLVIGSQDNCLIYFSEVEGKINGVSQITPVTNEREEIGKGGSIYRNQAVGNGKLIGDGTLENVGVITYRVEKVGDWYQLKSAADFECLALVLGTNGVLGSSAFDGVAYTELLKANYNVTSSVDISYDKTGIVTLNRNDTEDEAFAFSGQMRGANASVTITQNNNLKQNRMGLFSTLTGDVSFSDLTFAGKTQNAIGVGGIAYQTKGTSLTLTNITMKKEFENNTGYIGGVLARENSGHAFNLTAENITLAFTMNAGWTDNCSGFITEMDNATVSMTDVTLGGKLSSIVNAEVGGFLGKNWTTIGGTIRNLDVQSGTVYEANGIFGVLLNDVTNDATNRKRLVLDTIELRGLTVNALAAQNNCSLLIQDATALVAEIIDYDSTGCVVNNPGPNFDEIAGKTEYRVTTFPSDSGIISLHSRSEGYFPAYHYENKVESLKGKTNQSTVYYYDVFQHLENEDGTINENAIITDRVLDTPEKVFVWNIIQMIRTDAKNTFRYYFANHSVPDRYTQDYTFKGELDLSGYSIYPTPKVTNGTYRGVENAKIIFGATSGMAAWSLSNTSSASQHYGLQGGLFYNRGESVKMTVNDITFSGDIANLGSHSGAFMVGRNGLSNGGSFTNITLDDLWIVNYNKEEGAGLFISNIPDNEVIFKNIVMKNYPAVSGQKAASALIGSAGSSSAADLTLRFSEMEIADDVDGGRRHNGDVLAHASFIYSYDYTDNATINKGSGIYLFTEEDAKADKVTYGKELTEGTEFSNTSNLVLETMRISADHYKPYVYIGKKIEVNPKTGDILKGCGTYEDPYIIEDAKQFLTLYRYINEMGTAGNYQYATFYGLGDGWKIIKPGTDSSDDFCSEKHMVTWNSETGRFEGSAAHVADAVAFGEEGFPTPEELSRAYYQLGADINLTDIEELDETYKNIADEFVGFGTETRPFVGVWYGANHTVTMPDKTGKTYPNYGFIQYAQGAVVKDITIRSNVNTNNAPTIYSTSTGSGGGVIATILGGDNIIDNVTVETAFNVNDQYTTVGGYVGVVKKGGLILRNIESSDLASFDVNFDYSDVFCVLGAVVGKVEDGYVIYQGSGSGSYIWSGITAVNGYPAIPDYSIMNGDALQGGSVTVNTSTSDSVNYDVTITIPNAVGLQIMSMALNSDALNVRPSDYIFYTSGGYSEKSRSRKAMYNSIGHNAVTQDYVDAAKYDNVMGYDANANKAYAYPYLYDLLGISDDAYLNYWIEVNGQGHTVLNPSMPFATTAGTKYYRISWQLAENANYDMSQFGNAFRGIGAVYQTGNGHGGTFHGNFDGNNSTINLQMTRRVLATEVNIDSVPRVGLFNTILGNDTALYNIPADFSESTSSGGSTDPEKPDPEDPDPEDPDPEDPDPEEPDPDDPTDPSEVEAYDPTKIYVGGELVSYNGAIYQAQWWTQGAAPGTTNAWKLVSGSEEPDPEEPDPEEPDPEEPDPEEPIDPGVEVFDINKSYNLGDRVLYEGSIYECLYQGIWGWPPTTAGYWKLVSAAPAAVAVANVEMPDVVAAAGDNLVNCFEIKDFKLAGNINGTGSYNVLAGGVAACIEGANYIITNVSVDSANPLVVGSTNYDNNKTGNAGGVLGLLGNNANVLIRNCKFVGTEAKPFRVYGFGNVGGLVGNVGGLWSDPNAAITLKIENVQMDHLRIDYSEASTGGLVGYAYAGKVIIAGTEENPISVTDSIITGTVAGGHVGQVAGTLVATHVKCNDSSVGTRSSVESAGGIIGVATGKVTISDVACAKLTMYSYANIGGVIGRASGSNGTATLRNITVTDLLMEEQGNYNGQTEGIGGIVGRNELQLTIQNAKVTGTKTGDTFNFRILGSEQVRTALQGVGGVVGHHVSQTNALTLRDVSVNTVQIATDIRLVDGYVGQNMGAGGIVGVVGGPIVLDTNGAITAENLNVSVALAKDVTTDKVMAAGGCFGYVYYKDTISYGSITGGTDDTYYNGLVARGNTVTGKHAGGLIGYNDLGWFKLGGVTVENGSVTSDEIAGGIFGYLIPYYSKTSLNPADGEVAQEPTNLVQNMTISGKTVGGAFGYVKMHGALRAENIDVKNNTILGSSQVAGERVVGGLIGGYEATNSLECLIYDINIVNNEIAAEVSGNVEAGSLAVGGVLGKTINNGSDKKGKLSFDAVFVENTNRIGVKQSNSDKVQLIKTEGSTYQIADVVLPATGNAVAYDYNAVEKLEAEYGCFIGSIVGVWEAANIQMYLLDSKEINGKFVPPVMASNPPVVDVGRNASQGVDDYRSNCHIIYGAELGVASAVDKNLADMKIAVENAESEYLGSEGFEALLTELRVPKATMDLFNLSYADSYQFPGTELKIEFPMLVYRVQNGTLQEVMEGVTDVMTNMAGASSSDMEILSIQCTPRLFDGVKHAKGEKAGISATVTDGVATYTMEAHDGVIDNKLSYTEITYTYKYKNNSHKKVFTIPVFVEEPILYSVHSKIMEGKVADVSAIRTNGTSEVNNNIIMANDSDYTLLLEYTYGEARKQMVDGVVVDKVFYLEQNSKPKAWKQGTQLLLIDVTGGNKPYYYTVESDEIIEIEFTDFRDSSGLNPYVNPSINTLPDETDEGQEYYTDLGEHQLTNTAVERFLLTVLSNDDDIESKLYSFHAGIEIEDENLASRFQLEEDHKEETVWNITAIPGLKVSFVDKGSATDISGIISKTDGITVKAAFALQAQDIYWVERTKPGSSVIDSSNTAKYLEVAFYLRDTSGNRVALPDGTNVSYELADGNYSGNRVIPDDTMFSYYKDIRNQFGIDDFEYFVSDINENTTVELEYILDFSGADLSTILDSSYVAWLELLRTANRDYPMGNGNEVDNYSETINANAMQELGFALRADNLESLAINTYPVPTEQNEIPGHIMFDFSENLKLAGNGAGRDLVLEKWSGLDYEVTYQLYKKTANGYVAYTGENLPIQISAKDQTGIEKASKTGSLTVTYNFTSGQIGSGNGEDAVEGVLSFPCLITQDTAELVGETDSLTNYRLEATLSIKEKGVTGEVAEKTTDFFVYTVTKLKFDL